MKSKTEKKKKNDYRYKMSTDVIGGLVALILLFGVFVCAAGYNGITTAFMEEYASVTQHMANEATMFVNGDHIDDYLAGDRKEEYAESKENLDLSCQLLNVSLIYIIKVDTSDYGRFVSIFNSVNNHVDDSNYKEWPIGYERDTTNEEYQEKYRLLYTKESYHETVFRLKTDDGSHPHITTMVPVFDSKNNVVSILCIQRPVREMADAFRPYFLLMLISVFTMVIILIFLSSGFIGRSVIAPVEKVSAEATRFARENTRGEPLGDISRYIELQDLAHSIDSMETDMLNYIDNLTAITTEKERVRAELSIAQMIQEGALPDKFPPFPDHKEFDIYASMDPAREVGGDFYNFFFVDDEHLAIVIADVSGKGIPGALFMMVSDLIISGRAHPGLTPAEILMSSNNILSEKNAAEMFVTVWLGILNVSTGHMLFANAGHEYPAIYRKEDDAFELLKDKHGFVLGGMKGIKYANQELQLNKGDKLFLYTDGVPEATDKENNMFGTDRMIDALNSQPDADPKQILETVRSHVDGFVKDAEQFDDLTMLCIQYNGL